MLLANTVGWFMIQWEYVWECRRSLLISQKYQTSLEHPKQSKTLFVGVLIALMMWLNLFLHHSIQWQSIVADPHYYRIEITSLLVYMTLGKSSQPLNYTYSAIAAFFQVKVLLFCRLQFYVPQFCCYSQGTSIRISLRMFYIFVLSKSILLKLIDCFLTWLSYWHVALSGRK